MLSDIAACRAPHRRRGLRRYRPLTQGTVLCVDTGCPNCYYEKGGKGTVLLSLDERTDRHSPPGFAMTGFSIRSAAIWLRCVTKTMSLRGSKTRGNPFFFCLAICFLREYNRINDQPEDGTEL